MKHHQPFVLLGLSCLIALLPTALIAVPPFQTRPELFDRESHTLGLKVLNSQHRLLFQATEDSYQYCHHPNLVVFQDKLYCMLVQRHRRRG